MNAEQIAAPRRAQDMDARALIQALQELRRENGTPGFWPRFCPLLATLCRARGALALEGDGQGAWRVLGTGGSTTQWLEEAWPGALAALAERATHNGYAINPLSDAQGLGHILLVVKVQGAEATLLALDIAEQERPQLNELVVRALLVADVTPVPAPSPSALAVPVPGVPAHDLADWVALAAEIMQQARFAPAALALVNGVVARLGLMQAALGWATEAGAMRAVAISHLERFESNANQVRRLEAALDEAAEGGQPVWWPSTLEPQGVPVPAHEALLEDSGHARVCSLPLADEHGQADAVMLLAFAQADGDQTDLRQLRIMLELVVPWLRDLRARDRWWGRRLAAWARAHLESLTGPGHVWAKTSAFALTLLLLYALIGTWEHRLDATAQLTTDSTRIVSAQFDGRVDEVLVTAGEMVRQAQLLATLDVKDLRLQEAELQADLSRQTAEAAKNRATGNLAEMEIAHARLAQAEAKLARTRDYIALSRNQSPFDGVVVEGERKELLGLPVKKGDRLFKVARIEGLYVSLLLAERDVRYVQPQAQGEMYLLSRPDLKVRFELTSLIPVAQVKGQEGNHFMLRARLLNPPEDWWRPGMTGVARIDAGERNIAWLLTHRVIDTLRMKLWW